MFMRQQTGKIEIRLAAVNKFLFAFGDRLGRVLRRCEVERLVVFQMPGNPPDAEAEGAPQHRNRNGPPHHRPCLIGSGLPAIIIITCLDRSQPHAKGALQIEEATPGQLVAGCRRSGIVDILPDRVREMRVAAVQIVHLYRYRSEPIVKPGAGPRRSALGRASPMPSAVAAFSSCRIDPSVNR
jgi:hypothetical protein